MALPFRSDVIRDKCPEPDTVLGVILTERAGTSAITHGVSPALGSGAPRVFSPNRVPLAAVRALARASSIRRVIHG